MIRTLTLFTFALALAQPILAQSATISTIVIEPSLVTSQTPVSVRIWGVALDCIPRSMRTERSGNTTTITWLVASDPWRGNCVHAGLPNAMPWQTAVQAGPFEPGLHEIILRLEQSDKILGKVQVNVVDAASLVRINPPSASSNGGTKLTFEVASTLLTAFSMSATIGDVTIPFAYGQAIEAPPHAPGPVDVKVNIGAQTHVLRGALRYFDPDAVPDEVVFERFLVPILYSGPGAFGSDWRTEAGFVSSTPTVFATNLAKPVCTEPCTNDTVPPLERFSLNAFGQHPSGLLLFLQRVETPKLHFYANVRDVSRQADSWGAEIPIVREADFMRDQISFPAVPLDPKYRQTLRIYGVDGVQAEVVVRAGSKSRTVTLTSSCSAN